MPEREDCGCRLRCAPWFPGRRGKGRSPEPTASDVASAGPLRCRAGNRTISVGSWLPKMERRRDHRRRRRFGVEPIGITQIHQIKIGDEEIGEGPLQLLTTGARRRHRPERRRYGTADAQAHQHARPGRPARLQGVRGFGAIGGAVLGRSLEPRSRADNAFADQPATSRCSRDRLATRKLLAFRFNQIHEGTIPANSPTGQKFLAVHAPHPSMHSKFGHSDLAHSTHFYWPCYEL